MARVSLVAIVALVARLASTNMFPVLEASNKAADTTVVADPVSVNVLVTV